MHVETINKFKCFMLCVYHTFKAFVSFELIVKNDFWIRSKSPVAENENK